MFKFLSRFWSASGVVFIILFCSFSIFLSFIVRDLEDTPLRQTLSYSSFFENRFFDYRLLRSDVGHKRSDKITLVKIDDESLQKIGLWPIPRTNWVNLINRLKENEAKVLVFDIMFPEESGTTQNGVSVDTQFKESIENFQDEKHKIILPYTIQKNHDTEVFEELPEEMYNFIMDSKQESDLTLPQVYIEKYTYPIKTLVEASPELGYITMNEDTDGVFRHYQLVANIGTLFFPSIGLRAYESFTGNTPELKIKSTGEANIKLKTNTLPLNNTGETKLRWIGSSEIFDEVPLWKILEASEKDKDEVKSLLKDRIVFIASTARGAHDLRNTPIDSKLPGVYAHINLVSMLLNEYFYRPIDASIKMSFIIMTLGLVILIFIMSLKKAIIDLLCLFIISFAAYYVDSIYFLPHGYEIKLFFTLASFLLTYSWLTFLNFNQVSQEKKQIRGAFSRYVAPAVVDEMLGHPDKLKIGGEKKEITCLFSDVRDFTSISEKLSATELAMVLNRYMGKMTDIVFETEGTLDKYIGDAIVAFWGAPIDRKDHAQKAVDAAVLMIEAMPSLNQEFKEKNYPEFKIGIGLNSGECSVGNMGSDQIFAYTALGDNMNLGARLESLCKHYGAMILISEYTYESIDKTKYKTRLIDKVAVKGKSQAVKVYEVLHSGHQFQNETLLNEFNQSYKLFCEKDFEKAIVILKHILNENEDKPSTLLLKKCENYLENQPHSEIDHTITVMHEK